VGHAGTADCFPHLPRAASNSFPAAGSRSIGCPLKARILEKSWAAIDKEKPAFKIEQKPRFSTGRNPLFKTAVACLLSRGSGRHGKGKNPVNGYIRGISHGSLGDMFQVWWAGVDGRL
jgi:hypothetical protein